MVSKKKVRRGTVLEPTMRDKTMLTWFKENVLALLVIAISGVGIYTIAVDRITILEVQVIELKEDSTKVLESIQKLEKKSGEITLEAAKRHLGLQKSLEMQELRAKRFDKVIDNNTMALNKIAVLFGKVTTTLDSYGDRLDHLEENK